MDGNLIGTAALMFSLMMSWPAGGSIAAQTKDELPLHTQRLSDRVLFAWVGDHMQMIRVVALLTARGTKIEEAIWERLAETGE